MSTFPRLSESDVRRWVGEASFGRGQRYFRQGNILNPRRQGDTLKARCLGSRPQPYQVEVTLGPGGIAVGGSSCPVGGGGHCKHAAALLLAWLHEPDAFLEMAIADGRLGGGA
ncbi:MAG: SWIM zinc finger domain-containing protein [Anaerolineae bacterium]